MTIHEVEAHGSPQPSTSYGAIRSPSSVGKSPQKFKRTHRRNESKLSRISHLSIRSLRGGTIDEEDEFDGEKDESSKKPIYLFESVLSFCPWMPKLYLPGSLRLKTIKKKIEQFWKEHKKYDKRVFVVGNKFSEHLYRELHVDHKRDQTSFEGPKRANRYHTSKYTFLTFVPYNLYEQFRRMANIYFLLTMILTMVLEESPISPSSWILSLVFVILVTMIKQGYEDYLRHKSDNQTNKKPVHVIRNGSLQEIIAEDIMVGDIVYLVDNEMIPCDMVVLSTSQDQGQCYTMTANLDGETSLKTRLSSPLTKNMRSLEEIDSFAGCIECENPNPKLDNFLGRMHSFGNQAQLEESVGLSAENLLLTGAQLKNTSEVYGVCVYAGPQTKIHMNSLITHNKFSSVERALNRYLVAFVVVLLFELGFSTFMTMQFGVEYVNSSASYGDFIKQLKTEEPTASDDFHWYLGSSYFFKNTSNGLTTFLLWMVLYNYIIPISLYVSLELQKFVGSMFVQWDQKLMDDNKERPAIVRTSDINEELGLVTHLFSDKTGTLTQNVMIFRQFCQNGKVYDVQHLRDLSWNHFTMGMTLCHSVEYTSGHFVASSPDEFAIVDSCNRAGLSFCGEEMDGTITVCTQDGHVHTFKKLAELQFDSFRKCMSVIVRPKKRDLMSDSEEEPIYVFTKGAETSVLPICTSGPVDDTSQIVDHFASEGLRTLVYAYKVITREQFNTFSHELEQAKQSIVNRIKYVRRVYKEMETGMTLLGATGIEDKLQDKVVETIEKLHRAGITTWMLTGDKKETAVNMAHAAGMVVSNADLIDFCEVLDRKSLFTLVDEVYTTRANWTFAKPCLVIDGKAISAISKSPSNKSKLSAISTKCHSVIACRLSPVQKSHLVTMIKEADTNFITCAIGDGGNDVSMIQEAHVGLGLIGREGSAASQSADFAFTKFCHLQRLLLVHGHWFYTRHSFLVQYSFYKNIACFTCQLIFAFFSNFSGSTLYESIFLFLYNTLYTAVPVVVYGLTEQKYTDQVLLQYPELYKKNRGNALMTKRRFCMWFFLGIWHSLAIFFPWYLYWNMVETSTVFGHGLTSLGAVIAGASCTVVNLKILLEAKYWSWLLVLSVLWSIGSYVAGTVIYDSVLMDNVFVANYDVFYTYNHMFDETLLVHFAITIFIIVAALLPDFVIATAFDIHDRLKVIKKTVPQ